MKTGGNFTSSIMKKRFRIPFILLFSLSCFLASHAQSDSYREFIQTSGDIIQVGLPLSALIMNGIHKDKEGTIQLFYGLGTTFILTHALKRTIRKKRPDPSEAYNAFPSGHTSVAFHAAAYLQKRYGWKYGVPALLLSTFTGYSRVEGIDKKHDVWDVLGGALLGSVSAYVFTKTKGSENVSLSFAQRADMFSVHFQLTLQ